MLLRTFTFSFIVGLTAIYAAPPLPLGQDLAGNAVAPLAADPGTKAVVLFFVAPDCPISNRYAPTIVRIARDFGHDGVKTWLIYSDDLADPEVIQQHLNEFNLGLPIAIDRSFTIADYTGADVTPEAVVYGWRDSDSAPQLLYRGRIDDQYEGFGKYRPAATQHDLRSLQENIIAGEFPNFTSTKAIGCYIPRPQP